jgi:hypothetical protein
MTFQTRRGGVRQGCGRSGKIVRANFDLEHLWQNVADLLSAALQDRDQTR